MGTTADKLAKLNATKADLKAALAEKGQTVEDVFSTYPAAVRAISGPAPNGRAWTQSNITTGGFSDAYYAYGLWVACGQGTGLFYSSDGKTWTQSNITTGIFVCARNNNGLWLACSLGEGIFSSEDGKTWSKVAGIPSKTYVFSLCCGNDLWVASMDYGVCYSVDGDIWHDSNCLYKFNAIYYADGSWIGLTDDFGLFYSLDGKTWTQSDITNGSFKCAYKASGFCLVGSTGDGLYMSWDNGESWGQNGGIPTGATVSAIFRGNGLFVAVTDYGPYYSKDGYVWNIGEPSDLMFEDVYYADKVWTAPSIYGTGIHYSMDGKTWQQSNISSGQPLFVRHADGMWVAGSGSPLNNVPQSANGLYYSPTWEP